MSNLFQDFPYFNGDISQWDVSNVTDMSNMFEKSQFQGNILDWNVTSVTNVKDMFKNSSFSSNHTPYWNLYSLSQDDI